MSVLTMARITPQRLDGQFPTLQTVPLASGATVFVGGLVCMRNSDGLAVRAATATGLRAVGILDNQPAGIPAPSITTTVSGVVVRVKTGCFKFNNDPLDPIANAQLLLGCYITDDQTVCKTPSGGKSYAGRIVAIDDSTDPTGAGVWVEVGTLPTSAPAPTGLFLP